MVMEMETLLQMKCELMISVAEDLENHLHRNHALLTDKKWSLQAVSPWRCATSNQTLVPQRQDPGSKLG